MRKSLIGLLTMIAVCASGVALAQQPKAPTGAPAAQSKVVVPPAFVRGQIAGQTLARDRLIGAKVYNRDGVAVGDIEDLVLGPNNQVIGVIIGVGGFLGVGEKKIGVQYWALQFLQKDGRTQITLPQATKEVLAAVQPFQRLEPRKSLVERGKETARDAASTVKEKAGPAYERAKDAAGSAIEKAKEAVKPAEPPKQ